VLTKFGIGEIWGLEFGQVNVRLLNELQAGIVEEVFVFQIKKFPGLGEGFKLFNALQINDHWVFVEIRQILLETCLIYRSVQLFVGPAVHVGQDLELSVI